MPNPVLILTTAALMLVAFLIGASIGALARRLTLPRQKPESAVLTAPVTVGSPLVTAPTIAPLARPVARTAAERLAVAAGRDEAPARQPARTLGTATEGIVAPPPPDILPAPSAGELGIGPSMDPAVAAAATQAATLPPDPVEDTFVVPPVESEPIPAPVIAEAVPPIDEAAQVIDRPIADVAPEPTVEPPLADPLADSIAAAVATGVESGRTPEPVLPLNPPDVSASVAEPEPAQPLAAEAAELVAVEEADQSGEEPAPIIDSLPEPLASFEVKEPSDSAPVAPLAESAPPAEAAAIVAESAALEEAPFEVRRDLEPPVPEPGLAEEPAEEEADEFAAMRAIESGDWSPRRRARPSRPVQHPEYVGPNEVDAAMQSARSAVASATAAAAAAIAESAEIDRERRGATAVLEFEPAREAAPRSFLEEPGAAHEHIETSGLDFETKGHTGFGRPEGLSAPRDAQADNLKQIKGVTPQLESSLNGLGVYHFDQIAGWDQKAIVWMDNHLSLKGRIGREKWLEQARDLGQGRSRAARPVRR